jgi:energy-coupling factor transporter transmembrane protein EcfT
MEDYTNANAFTKEYLIIYEYALYAILYLFSKDELHKWISSLSMFLLIFYIFVGRHFDYSIPDFIVACIFILFWTIFYIKIVRVHRKIDKKNLSLRPLVMVFLFIGSYILGVNAKHFHLSWYTGYMLATISFLIGVFIYKRQPNKKKGKMSK